MSAAQIIGSDSKFNRLKEENMIKSTRQFTILSLFIAFAVILGYIEYLIPFDFGIYGFKIGLSNIATVVFLYTVGGKRTLVVLFCRIFIVNILFGTGFSMIFSLTAGIFSFFSMLLLKKVFKCTIVFASIVGGTVHNFIQVLTAYFLVKSEYMLALIPILAILGMFTGFVVGIISRLIYMKIYRYIEKCYG